MSTNLRQLSSLKPALLDLAHLALSSIQEPSRWQDYLSQFCTHFRASRSYLALFANQFEFGAASIYHGYTPSEIREWESKWIAEDPWLKGRDLSSLPLEKAVPSHHLCSDEDLIAHPIYDAFLAPRHLHYGGGVNYLMTPDLSALQIVLRSREAGPLSNAELDDWNQIIPYVKTAIAASLEHSQLSSENDLFNTHFASLGTGLLFLTPRARITRCNTTACEIIDRRPDILTRDGHLSFTKPSIEIEFRKALKDLSGESALNINTDNWRKIAITQDPRHATSPLLAILTPVTQPHRRSFDLNTYSILMYLIESQPPTPTDTHVLEKLFGWTPTEARLAGLLATGRSLEEVAAILNIAIQTARTHLKHLFAKTGFTRQGELIAFINRLSLRDPIK